MVHFTRISADLEMDIDGEAFILFKLDIEV